ncbi:MAG: hypothetical protein JO282_08335 [Alphaproteobacteria bacterium]|nr:hypothetical protein [Alphaproteobacteria bacterium]
MIVRSALPLTLRTILDRVGFALMQQGIGLTRGIRLGRWQRIIAARGDWSAASNPTWRSAILLRDRPERFHRFCQDCAEETPHEGFDEFGAGWYAQIYRCHYCREQGMRVWPLAWW